MDVMIEVGTSILTKLKNKSKKSGIPFDDVLSGIDVFLCPVWHALVSNEEFSGVWNGVSWEKWAN
jgi:hypothetical protein